LCFILSDLKWCYGSATSTFRNHPTYKTQFFSFLFFSLWTPPTFKTSNFLISCSFSTI
jgi:hypothetical protein